MLKVLDRRALAETRESADGPDGSTAAGSWAWPAAVLAAVSLAPFLVVDTPAVLDYPNHLARFFILAHPHEPVLSRMYAPHWRLLPNVGMDVLGQALLRVATPDIGGRLMLALSLFAPGIGAVLYARAAFGRWTWWSLGAGVIAYNGIFFLGFMNCLLGMGMALAGAGAWRVLRRRAGSAKTAGAGALIGLAVFFCHLLGFVFFAVLLGAQEAEELTGQARARRLNARGFAVAAGRLAAALGPAALLYLVIHRPTRHGDPLSWSWAAKGIEALVPFLTYDLPLSLVTAAVLGGAAVLAWRRARRASGAALALVALLALFLLAPFEAAGGTFVDTRLPLMAALLLFAGIEPRWSPRAGATVAIIFGLLAAGRCAQVAIAWRGRANDLAELRAELALVPTGAKILPARTPMTQLYAQRNGRALPMIARMDGHLLGLAVIERRAFWPILFADPNQQTVVVRTPYDQLSQPLGAATPWSYLAHDPATRSDIADFPYLADWRRRFDYVLTVGPPSASDEIPRSLALIRRGEAASLYRIDRGR